ncbi:DUF254-domain-containing protein [Testicularia cyperi]|uniref:Vacuolar fusion protein MON1 n=1 Tax=Testicularia cyperi TaxID=1882483 RepID=A0A317XZU6_9BASI|nr:DUF254-domain-containing protein [Testicularia cyperi]
MVDGKSTAPSSQPQSRSGEDEDRGASTSTPEAESTATSNSAAVSRPFSARLTSTASVIVSGTEAGSKSHHFKPRAGLAPRSLTSSSVTTSTTSSLINVGASTSTAADTLASRSQPVSGSSTSSTRSSTPLPNAAFSHSPQPGSSTVAESSEADVFANFGRPQDGAREANGLDGNDSDADGDEVETVSALGGSVHALDLLHKVNDRAAERAATIVASSSNPSLRTRFSHLSISRASSSHRIPSDKQSEDARSLRPDLFVPPEVTEVPAPLAAKSKHPDTPAIETELLDEALSEPIQPPEQLTDAQPDSFQDRKYYILSSAGKPIYNSHTSRSRARSQRRRRDAQAVKSGEESKNNVDAHSKQGLAPIDGAGQDDEDEEDDEDESSTTQVGVMQALISIFADEESDKLRYIRQGRLMIVFLLRAPLYLVCVSNWGEEASTLRQQLEYLHLQVISLVSGSQLTRLFARMPNFDLRRLLEGTEGIFDHLVSQLNANPDERFQSLQSSDSDASAAASRTDWASTHQWWLQALQPVRITIPNLRDQLTTALQPPAQSSSTSASGVSRPKDLLYVILIANGRIVTLLRPKKHSVHPIDLLMLINTVMGSQAIKRAGGQDDAEIWLPFSMPKFAPQGFVHAYVKFFDPASWTGIAEAADLTTDTGGKPGPELAIVVVTGDKEAFPQISTWISSLMPDPPPAGSHATQTPTASASVSTTTSAISKLGFSTSSKPSSSASSPSGFTATPFQLHSVALYRHLCDPVDIGHDHHQHDGSWSSYTCAELGLAGLRHFVYRSNSSIQLTSPVLPEPYSTGSQDRKRLLTLYSLLHHSIHNPVPPSSTSTLTSTSTSNSMGNSTPTSTQTATQSANNHPTFPDTRLKMHLLKTTHEQVLGWITQPFELYLCLNPQLSKSSIVAIANTLTKWIKNNEKQLFLVNAGTF